MSKRAPVEHAGQPAHERPRRVGTIAPLVNLLEREEELEALAAAAAGAREGKGGLVLVWGEAGIGKTSLVRALRERCAGGVTFLAGACEPLSVPVPLGPWREIAEAAGGDDPISLGSDDRLVLCRAILGAMRARAPAVAVLEDIHWADPLTLDVLRFVARRVEDAGVAVIATYRDDEVGSNESLGLLLGDLASAPALRRLALRPLSEGAVRGLASEAGLDAARLSRATGGNPFLVVEAIAAGGVLPSSVRDAALARVGRLGPAARSAAEAAAAIGARFEPDLLAAVEPGSGEGIDEALARGVLVAEEPGLGFRHELIREAIEGSIPPVRRAALHARVVAVLEEAGAAVDHARLAHHAELGGLRQKACRYAALAAAEAARVGALPQARLQAQRALRLGPDMDPRERMQLLVLCSRAANFSSVRLEEAVTAAEQALSLAEELDDPVGVGTALGALAYALWSLERRPEARAAAERAIAVLEPVGDGASLARARATGIRIEATAFDPAAAIAAGPQALELAREAGLGDVAIDVSISVALARGHRGEREALPALEAAAAAARRARLTIPTVRAYVNLVFLAATLRDHARVDRATAEALALFAEYQATIPGYAIELYRASSLLDRGRFAEALAIVRRDDRDWVVETAGLLAVEGIAAARHGDPSAQETLERAWSEIEALPEESRHATIRVALVEAAWLRGEREAALEQLHAARAAPACSRFARYGGELALWGARLGVPVPVPENAPAPVGPELEGDWRGAIRAWGELEAPCEAALAALPGDDRAARAALATLRRLGAAGVAAAFVRERAARGRPARGPRRSTLANPAGLTRREQEVLERLASGATNAAIAATLHLSERTVAHHVSAILGKLGASNRVAAIERARERGLLRGAAPAPEGAPPAAPQGGVAMGLGRDPPRP